MSRPELTDEEIREYLNKPATVLQTRFADWLIDKLGIEFSGNAKEAKAKEAQFREAIRLSVALRMTFQASPENQAAIAESKAGRNAETPAVEPVSVPEKPKRKGRAAQAAVTEVVPEEPPVEETAEKPAKRGGRKAKATAPPVAPPEAAVDSEASNDTTVAPAGKASKPRKAAARTGKAAPF